MTRFSWLPNRALRYTALTSGALGLFLLMAPYALADYVPPSEPSSPQESTSSTGRRGGCDGEAETELTALAPQSYVGQTISTHPTFAWFIPDTQPFQVEFRLFEYNSGDRQLIQKIDLQSSPGIMSWSLPPDQPGLSTGQRYFWQVVVHCDLNRPSSALVAEAEIEVVEIPSDLEMELDAATDDLARVRLYGEAGLWYDAFNEVLAAGQDAAARDTRLGLLDNLVNSEVVMETSIQEHQVRLTEIIELERSL
ncbi:MAG: DUF928 domain-containing protein [Leptolyngbyaceae cyanobacterium RM2_2_4]|nr:DUF928 domain-containing protein [Leptolyngbyaceae cyanobacterium SL_5_14]NJO50050.1 DUF928 domain-containing protein [Leptolyngbyaceae cyanobacterium RM2_2_4]